MVVGKTGSAEVPTDPMPPEATDLIIALKPKSEWTTTKDYNELAAMMIEKLEVIPESSLRHHNQFKWSLMNWWPWV